MRLAGLTIALVLMAAAHAGPGAAAKAEIDYLLSAIANSDCRFYRNGTWYDAKSAAAHLRYKYETMSAKDLIHDADEFVDKAATRSSLSGGEYAIKCEGAAELSSRQWLTGLLASYRAARPTSPR